MKKMWYNGVSVSVGTISPHIYHVYPKGHPMKKEKTTPSSLASRGKILAFSALGAYLAVICAGIIFNLAKGSVIEPSFVINLHPVTYAVAWAVLTAILALYGCVSASVVYGFAWISSVCYALAVTVSGGSYLLTFAACGLVTITTIVCGKALRSVATEKKPTEKKPLSPVGGRIAAGVCAGVGLVLTLFLLLSSYLSFTTSPSVSTGVYVQLLESLKGFSFDTTLEFGETVSHMAAHISPIFLVYLPFYALIPSPVTVMVLQTVAVYSAVIPLWLIARRKGLSPALSAVICGLLCFFPAVWGGAAGSVHEYALLLPLLLWLLWSLEARRGILPWVFALLILCVRETCAIHLLAVGLYHVSTVEGREDAPKARRRGLLLMGISVAYFIAAMALLTHLGKGTLITRFSNVTGIYGTSFTTLLREIFYNPAIALYEMLAEAKLHYLLCLLLPLGLIPLCTKKKAGLVFLLPLLSLNLLSDFPYHFSLDYPYSFGVAAFSLFLTVDALAGLSVRSDKAILTRRLVTLAMCFTLIVGVFRLADYSLFTEYTLTGQEEVASMTDLLASVEEDASVSASGRLIPSLADREEVYYLHQGQLTEYVVIDLREEWAVDSDAKYNEKYYTDQGYTVVKRCEAVGVVLKKGS